MVKKRLLTALFVVFPLIVGLACRFSPQKDPTATPTMEETIQDQTETVTQAATEGRTTETETVSSGETQELKLLDKFFWMRDGLDVFVAFFFENVNIDITFEDVDYTLHLLDASGNELQSESDSVRWIFPSQTLGIVSMLYLDDENQIVDSVSIDWEYGTSSTDGLSYPFSIDDTIFWQNGSYPIVTGIIDNNSADTYTNIRTNVICYNNAGEIVGGGYTHLDFVPGSDFMGFAANVDTFDDVAYVEVYPTFTYGSLFYEGKDFWSEIAILDDYFYTDDFGSLLGGVIIQSNIDTPLSDSVAYVTFYDDSGNITSIATEYIDFLLPGDTLGFAPWAMFPPEGAITSSYDILVLPGDYVNDYELMDNPFQINSATLTGDYDDYVAVNFTNTYNKQASEVTVYVLVYDDDGNIIGGGSDWTSEPTPASGDTDIEVWVDYDDNRTVDSIDVWVCPSYWTEFE
jgi:hypothetical protein